MFFISNIVFFIFSNGYGSFFISFISLYEMLDLYLSSLKSIVITIILISLFTNSSICIVSFLGSISIDEFLSLLWVIFFCFFACLVVFFIEH